MVDCGPDVWLLAQLHRLLSTRGLESATVQPFASIVALPIPSWGALSIEADSEKAKLRILNYVQSFFLEG